MQRNMKRLLLIIGGTFFLLTACQKADKISTAAFATLADYENAVYELKSIEWNGPEISRTKNTALHGMDLYFQLCTMSNYKAIDGCNKIKFRSAQYSEKDKSYSGNIELGWVIQSYVSSSDKPSECAEYGNYNDFSFSSYFITFDYKVDKNGGFTYQDTYTYSGSSSNAPHDERKYLSCRITELSKHTIVVEFPEFAVPDFKTDTFMTGSLTATYSRQ